MQLFYLIDHKTMNLPASNQSISLNSVPRGSNFFQMKDTVSKPSVLNPAPYLTILLSSSKLSFLSKKDCLNFFTGYNQNLNVYIPFQGAPLTMEEEISRGIHAVPRTNGCYQIQCATCIVSCIM